MNAIEQKAKEYANKIWAGSYAEPGDASEDSFESGAYWMLSNVRKWISRHGYEAKYSESIEGGVYTVDIDLLLEGFTKAMEEQL